ncbi:MAG: hypothetical protein ACQKBY_08705 [Verrucomicrobiales bacterium]
MERLKLPALFPIASRLAKPTEKDYLLSMSRPAHQLSFPCPHCQKTLTLSQPQATGPCPHCQKPIQVLFTAIAIPEEEKHQHKGYDSRHFRPDSRPVTPKHTPIPPRLR